MVDWWTHNGPPAYVPVAGYFGLIKPRKSKSGNSSSDNNNLNELLKLAGPGGMIN